MRLFLLVLMALGLAAQEAFLVKPYLQLGDAARPVGRERLDLLWQVEDQDARWTVEVKAGGRWRQQEAPTYRALNAPPLPAHRIYRVTLRNLAPGAASPYRVKRNDGVVFEAVARARPKGATRIIVTGDAADGSPAQAAVAQAMAAAQPDLVLLAGDLVYGRGRAAEYHSRFFPSYNSEAVPLMRSVPFLGVPGNHDVPFAKYPDASAYFAYWSLPLNGPALKIGEPGAAPMTVGTHDAMIAASGPALPRMASYSFDWGGIHFTMLDSNTYADWALPKLQAWLEADLRAARHAAWRVVVLHHPLFQSARSHFDDQWMRPISPILERHGVDLVLAGHVHNYQRSAPLRFKPTQVGVRGQPVAGEFSVDEAFDGAAVTRAKGIIHIVTGAGGAELYDPWQTDARASWQPWTRTFVSDRHSFTLLEVNGRTLRLRQLDVEGRELDSITLTR